MGWCFILFDFNPNIFLQMKNIIIIFLFLLNFQSLTKADDIKDFEIEGISIGSSLLSYMEKSYIEENKYYPSKKFKKFASISYFKNLKNYQELMINFNKNYEIASFSAFVQINNIEECKSTKKNIVGSISVLFLNTDYFEDERPYFLDKETYVYATTWEMDKGFLRVACYDWSEKSQITDELRVDVSNEEYKLYLDTVTSD